MNSVVKLQDVPETLDVHELMAVKGGILDKSPICILASAVTCTVAGAGVIITVPSESTSQSTQAK